MKCKKCGYPITEYQDKEYQGHCCGVCQSFSKEYTNCNNCGLPLENEVQRMQGFCSGGCAGEFRENKSM